MIKNRMRKYLKLLILIVILNFTALDAQNLKIIRTDVDSSRSDFVTAKYLFGVDIVGDSLFRCSAVSFSLRWSNEQYIKFSGWRPGTFGDSSATYVSSETGMGSGEGALYVGITAAEPYNSEGYDNPYFIHFDFAVLSSSVNGENSEFRFTTLRANVNTDSGRVNIELVAEPVTYNIHSFVSVWPGDTDNDGIVNNDDILAIDRYFDFGSEVKKSRTFKRDNSSAVWNAQKVLAWDEYDATFADCDGNGVVNEADVLVLGVNAGRTRLTGGIIKSHKKDCKNSNDNVQMDNIVLIPVYYSINDEVSGISGVIDLENLDENIKIKGIARNPELSESEFIFLGKLKPQEKSARFALVSNNKSDFLSEKGILCYLEAEIQPGANPEAKPFASIQNVIDSWGYITPYSPVTSVDDNDKSKYTVLVSSGILTIKSNNPETIQQNYSIYDIDGRLLISGENDSQTQEITVNIFGLSTGIYILNVDNNNNMIFNSYNF